jgi:2-haloacid dehalogenase
LTRPRAVVLDIGNVVVEWDPRFLYRTLFHGDDEAMERFLSDVAILEWNDHQDRGRPFAEGVRALVEGHPHHAELIEAFHRRWPETLGDVIEGTVAVVAELRRAGVPVYALSNFSAETFPIACQRAPLREWFDGIVVSGEEGVAKPDARIFEIVCERFALEPATTLFVDDSERNVAAAIAFGFDAVPFEDPEQLRRELHARGLL